MKKATLIKYTVLLLILLLATLFIARRCRHQPQAEEPTLTIADTPLTVEDVKPIGELYLYTTVTEDFEKGSFMGSGYGSSLLGEGNGILKKKHHCVQILRQQVSFTINLDEVVYEEDSASNIVFVTLPPVQFVQSTIHSWFKSDNEDEEGAVKYDASPLIDRVEAKIRKKYDTAVARAQATEKAKNVLTDIFQSCGKELIFNDPAPMSSPKR